MRIKEIELDNFKSFGRLTTIPMLDGFTTVSGPNGSGKSNVVDSLMFALGLTTTRNMRAERLTDLINNISGRNECAVKVTFLQDDDKTEVEVLRRIRVKKTGYESKYFLDGEPSTLGHIHDKLADFNISPRGFNVVMQGDVASIISMNSVDRRKIIDEIAGVAEFDRKIELADKELTIVQERIENQEVILEELKGRLEQLQGERDQAIKYAELKEKRTELEKQFLAVRIKQLRKDESDTSAEIENLQQLKTDLQIENNTINENMSAFQDELNKLSKDIEELGEGKQKELGLQRENKKEELTREESAREYVVKQIDDQIDFQKKLKKDIKALKESLKAIEIKEQEYTEEVKAIEANITEEQAKYNALQDKIRAKSADSNLSTQAVINIQETIAGLKEAKSEIEQEKARHDEKISLLNVELEKHKEEAEKVLNRLNVLRSQFAGAGGMQLDALKEQVDFQTKNLQVLKDEQKETRTELEKQELKLRKVQSDLDKIEGQEQAANAAGYGRAVESVLDVDGVHGTLAQLGSVDGKYQLAVETAAGARLRAVVADDDYVAQECIELLKERQAGRATFLPLNKIREAKSYPLPQDQGIIGWAVDLVDFDEEYRNAFAYAFADTLVVKNIEVARRMIGRYRMVTVQGDLVERSGAMTGGAAIKSNVHFGANADASKKRMEAQKEELESYVTQLHNEYNELESQLEEARGKIDRLKSELSSKEKESGTSSVQIQSLEEIYEKEKAALKNRSGEIIQLEEKLETLNDRIFIKDKEIEAQETKLQELAAEMKESGIEALVLESQDIEVEVKRYQTMMNNLISESKGLEAEKNFSAQNIDKHKTQLEESETVGQELEAKLPKHDEKITSLRVEVEKINEEIEKIKESLRDLQARRNSISEELIGLGQRRGEIKSKIESTAIKVVENKKKLSSIKEHLDQLMEELEEHPELEEMEIPEEDLAKLQAELTRIEKKMRSMEPVNMRAVEEYEEVSHRQTEIISKQQALIEERQMLLDKIDSYKNDKQGCFMENFNMINDYFQEIFADLSFGQGQLILEDPEEVFNGGLIIKAQPRGKKMQRLEAMSGGEKSLTALSFLFALQQCNPAPFYAFDEVDSALDGINVDRLAHKIRRNSENTQFIVVSHRRPMIDQSDRAVGVSVGRDGFSKIIGVKNIQAANEEDLAEIGAAA